MSTNLLSGSRIYLSGPMDFVPCRFDEKRFGWRTRVREFLKDLGATVFDPWEKPSVRGLMEYGREDVDTTEARNAWSFADNPEGAAARAACARQFRDTQHIDLRMVDTADLTIAYVPTHLYSVGTPHELILGRQQHKPVLFVSPPVTYPSLTALRAHLGGDEAGLRLLADLEREASIKDNPRGIPSLWYMPLIGSESFFDGFGFSLYRERFGWEQSPLDRTEEGRVLERPLLPFLESLKDTVPNRWDDATRQYVPDDDWLLWDLSKPDTSEE